MRAPIQSNEASAAARRKDGVEGDLELKTRRDERGAQAARGLQSTRALALEERR